MSYYIDILAVGTIVLFSAYILGKRLIKFFRNMHTMSKCDGCDKNCH